MANVELIIKSMLIHHGHNVYEGKFKDNAPIQLKVEYQAIYNARHKANGNMTISNTDDDALSLYKLRLDDIVQIIRNRLGIDNE